MMDVKQALYDFLTSGATLSDPVRNAARQDLRDLVGTRIYGFNRRPQDLRELSLTIARSSGIVHNGLAGPVTIQQPVFDLTIVYRDKPAKEGDAERTYTALKTLLHGYRGPLNASVTVQGIHLTTEPFDTSFAPLDGSDDWTHRLTLSFQVTYNATAPAGVN